MRQHLWILAKLPNLVWHELVWLYGYVCDFQFRWRRTWKDSKNVPRLLCATAVNAHRTDKGLWEWFRFSFAFSRRSHARRFPIRPRQKPCRPRQKLRWTNMGFYGRKWSVSNGGEGHGVGWLKWRKRIFLHNYWARKWSSTTRRCFFAQTSKTPANQVGFFLCSARKIRPPTKAFTVPWN